MPANVPPCGYCRRVRLPSCFPPPSSTPCTRTPLRGQTAVIFKNVCRGLFEKDKDLFAFLIASSIQRECGGVMPAEWNLFLAGVGAPGKDDAPPARNPWPERITPKQWAVAVAAQVRCFDVEQ